jgi:hypothetical protein
MSLYYTVAGLPGLLFGDPPPFSAEELADQCEGVLAQSDLAALRAVVRGDLEAVPGPFAAGWRRAETQLRNAVAAARAERRSEEPGPHLRPHGGFDVSIEAAVSDAFAKPNPLDRERELDRCRWRLLDELTRTEPFGPGTLLAYAVRLQIARRWADREAATGAARLEEALDRYLAACDLPAEA